MKNKLKLLEISDFVVSELLDNLRDVSFHDISEIVTENGLLDSYDPDCWEDVLETIEPYVRESIGEVVDYWKLKRN